MKALKNMEIIFTVAVALACSVAFTSVRHEQQKTLAVADNISVVVVSAKRMTAQEKIQSLAEERQQALVASNDSRM